MAGLSRTELNWEKSYLGRYDIDSHTTFFSRILLPVERSWDCWSRRGFTKSKTCVRADSTPSDPRGV